MQFILFFILLFSGLIATARIDRTPMVSAGYRQIEQLLSFAADDDKFVAALNCLRLTNPDLQLEYPSDAEEHLYEIRNAMAPWAHHAGHKIHSYIGLEAGPWVENYWIRNFEQGLYDKSDLYPGTKITLLHP